MITTRIYAKIDKKEREARNTQPSLTETQTELRQNALVLLFIKA